MPDREAEKTVWEVAVTVHREVAELVLLRLWEESPSGFEERTKGDHVTYVLYFDADHGPPSAFTVRLEQRLEAFEPDIQVCCRPVRDWIEVSKSHFKPLEIGTLRIVPPWERSGRPDELVIAPGMAFGTGMHESTRLALRLAMAACDEATPSSVIDVGCGTGILALAALKMGALRAVACDIDSAAIKAAEENAKANGLLDRLTLKVCDLAEMTGEPAYPMVIANMTIDLLGRFFQQLTALTEPGGILILSGLYHSQLTRIVSAFPSPHWSTVKRYHEGCWEAISLRREGATACRE